jgi:hypothetical protein
MLAHPEPVVNHEDKGPRLRGRDLLALAQPHMAPSEPSREKKKLDCTIKLNTTVNEFQNSGGKDKFIDNLSSSLGIDASTIDISSIREGSVIVDYTITVPENQME